jgi:hypothetical protein
MKSFLIYLRESTFDFHKIRGILNLPENPKVKTPKKIDNLIKAVDKLELAVSKKEIYNVDYVDSKQAISRVIEDKYSYLHYDYYLPAVANNDFKVRGEYFDKFPDSSLTLVSAKKHLLHWKKQEKDFPLLLKLAEIALEIDNVFKFLKPLIIKGKKPVENLNPNAFKKPVAKKDARMKAVYILRELISNVRGEYETYMINYNLSLLKTAKQNIPSYKSFNEISKITNPDLKNITSRVAKKEGAGWVVDSKAESVVVAMAKITVDEILSKFEFKNTEKLAAIFERKPKIAQHKVLSNIINAGVLENSMYFEFEDNSSFKIYSSVQYGYSKTGKPFMRVPTRFTDVIMTDGKKMSMPSEEKMITVF